MTPKIKNEISETSSTIEARSERDILVLQEVKEMIFARTKIGSLVGHYAGGEYFFYQNGNELFRSKNRQATKIFIEGLYDIRLI
jgi:hypothetical protein